MSEMNGYRPEMTAEVAKRYLDKNIEEAAAQLVGYDEVDDYPFTRFVLLCAARAELDHEGPATDIDPELRWVPVAKDAMAAAGKSCRREGRFPLPVLLSSDSDTIVESQSELYQRMTANLVIANTNESPQAYSGVDFASQVAEGLVQIRYV